MSQKAPLTQQKKLAAHLANQASVIIFDIVNRRKNANNGVYNSTPFELFNLGFICEQLLKAIMKTKGRGHKLRDLFDGLDLDTKNRIMRLFNKNSNNGSYKALWGDFHAGLDASSSAFEKYRYIHEEPDLYFKGGVRAVTMFLLVFVKTLNDYVIENYDATFTKEEEMRFFEPFESTEKF